MRVELTAVQLILKIVNKGLAWLCPEGLPAPGNVTLNTLRLVCLICT